MLSSQLTRGGEKEILKSATGSQQLHGDEEQTTLSVEQYYLDDERRGCSSGNKMIRLACDRNDISTRISI